MRSLLLPARSLPSPRRLWRQHGATVRLVLLIATAYAAALALDAG